MLAGFDSVRLLMPGGEVRPAAIGGLADRVSLPAALGVVVAVTALAALLAGALASRPQPAAGPSPS